MIGVFALTATALADEKYAQVGVGRAIQGDSIAYSFDFQFNRKAGTDPGSGPYLHVWAVDSNTVLALRPSMSADIGNGTATAANNVLLDCSLVLNTSLGATTSWALRLTPTGVADKEFQTGLLYLRFGPEILGYTSESLHMWVLLSVPGDYGWRKLRGLGWQPMARLVPNLQAHFEVGHFSFDGTGQFFFIHGDETVIANGSYGNLSISGDWRFFKPLKGPSAGIGLKYLLGYDQPRFAKTNAITMGLTLYR